MRETMRDVALDAIHELDDVCQGVILAGLADPLGDNDFTRELDRVDNLRRRMEAADARCHMSRETVTHQPTIDALGTVSFECSNCGWQFYMSDVCVYPDRPHFCPNCGARVIPIGA